MRLSNVAAPDTLGVGASDLGVVLAGEDVGVASLAVVSPARRHGGADAVHARHVRLLAEPAANEDALEFIGLSRGEHLAEAARVELVLHLAVAVIASLQGVGLESGIFAEVGEAELGSPLVDGINVTTAGRGRVAGLRRGSRAGLSDRSGWLRGRRGLSVVGLRRRRLDYDRGGLSGSRLVTLRGLRRRRGGSAADGLAVRANNDGDDGGLPNDMLVSTAVSTPVGTGSSHGGARKGEHTESSVAVHFEVWFLW